jgi:hypothetical protein
MGAHPGFFHFVALRPYDEYIPFMVDLRLMCAIVGAQCNEVEEARVGRGAIVLFSERLDGSLPMGYNAVVMSVCMAWNSLIVYPVPR